VQLTSDPIDVVNLVLATAVFVLGMLGWRKTGNPQPLYIGAAFGLFALSHLAAVLGLDAQLTTALIVVRTAAYLIVIYAMYVLAFRGNQSAA
jgi:hypothetical protein